MVFQGNAPNVTFHEEEMLKDLLKCVEDVNTEIQRIKEELEQVVKRTNDCTEEVDRRTVMMRMIARENKDKCDAILELDGIMKDKEKLALQIEELSSSSNFKEKQALLLRLQKGKSCLLEQEQNYKQKCELLRKSLGLLADSSLNSEVSQGDSPSQSKPGKKPLRKRRGRK